MPQPETTNPEDGKPEIELSDEASGQIEKILAENPEAAEAFREMFANMRQAMQAVKDGRHATFEDAMEAITGERPEMVNDEDC